MKRRLAQCALVLWLIATVHAADSLDRIVATVNHRPILASDLDDETHFEALQQGKPAAGLDSERRAVLNRIIERELIAQQIAEAFEPSAESLDKQELEIRKLYSAQTDQQWKDLLASYSLDEGSLREQIKLQLQVVHFLDVRLRPTVRVDRDEINDYYQSNLVPKLKSAGALVEPVEKVQDKIAELLIQQKITEVFNAWITNLRNQGSIQILDPDLAKPAIAAPEKLSTP